MKSDGERSHPSVMQHSYAPLTVWRGSYLAERNRERHAGVNNGLYYGYNIMLAMHQRKNTHYYIHIVDTTQ